MMKRSASEILRSLEARLDRLEKVGYGPYLMNQYYTDQYSRSEQRREERAEERRKKIEGPDTNEFLYGVGGELELDMLHSGKRFSLRVYFSERTRVSDRALVSHLNRESIVNDFELVRGKIEITSRHYPDFPKIFDFKLDPDSNSAIIYSGRIYDFDDSDWRSWAMQSRKIDQ